MQDQHREQSLLFRIEWVMRATVGAAILILLLDHGWTLKPAVHAYLAASYGLLSLIFLGGTFGQLLIRRDRWFYVRRNKWVYLINGLILLEMLVVPLSRWIGLGVFAQGHLVLLHVYIVANIGWRFVALVQFLTRYKTSPARMIVGSFGTLILIGSGLLLLPNATTGALHPLDALFTATSAVCVTGLIVVDTATAFTTTGQVILLGLIQLGGLGIMTVTAFFTILAGRKMSGREQVLLGNMLSTDRPAQLGTIIRAVFFTTLTIEAAGAVLLYLNWRQIYTPARALYTAGFHAISAFCNAGFSVFSDSLMQFAAHVPINLIMASLIVLGGLGFGTLREITERLRMFGSPQKVRRFSVQSRIIFVMTLLLLSAATVLFFMVESPNVLAELSGGERLVASFFQAVTFRTAGFNSVDFAALRPSTLILAVMMMFVGAAPGSTGGGLKVTTLAILLATVVSAARGKSRLELFHRTIPMTVLYQTIVVITAYLFVAVLVSFLLCLTETVGRPLDLVFETISALGTVGLSTGVTSHLSRAGKILIILTMFSGRIGPFTLALAIGQRQPTESYNYPEEEVQIG
jgi:trk system potassium uptake protein